MYVQKNDFQWVKVDFKQILAGDKKLEQGEKVDHDILSQLLLVWVINILAQHDTIVKNKEKVKQ